MCVCVFANHLTSKQLASTLLNQIPVLGSCHFSYALRLLICVLVCVCLYMHVCEYIMKVIKIDKCKQNRDDVTCNIKVEIGIHVHSDVKQAVKWQVFRYLTEYNTNK